MVKDTYITDGHMSREDILFQKLIKGFNLAPITAGAILDLSKKILLEDGIVPGKVGQFKFIAISAKEGPNKKIKDSEHLEILLTLDSPEDMEVYKKEGIEAYRQHVMLRIANEARDQGTLLRIKDLVKLLKTSYSTIKRDIKALRKKDIFVPIRGTVKDIGPLSHKARIVELYIKGYTPSEIERNTKHSIRNVEHYILDFSRVLILWRRNESPDSIRLIVGISESLTKEYIALCEKYSGTEFQMRLDEIATTLKVSILPATYKKTGVRR